MKSRYVLFICFLLLTIGCQNPFGSKDEPNKQYTLTMQVSYEGLFFSKVPDFYSISPSMGTHKYDAGTTLPIKVTGWSQNNLFTGWIGEVACDECNTTTVKMNKDQTVIAKFKRW